MPRRSTPDAFALQVGARLRELRCEIGMSLEELAHVSELSKGHISSIEHGLAAITIHTVARLAFGLGVPVRYLFINTENSFGLQAPLGKIYFHPLPIGASIEPNSSILPIGGQYIDPSHQLPQITTGHVPARAVSEFPTRHLLDSISGVGTDKRRNWKILSPFQDINESETSNESTSVDVMWGAAARAWDDVSERMTRLEALLKQLEARLSGHAVGEEVR